MNADRLRRGEIVVLAGILVLLASAFLKWFSIDRVESNSRGVVVSVFGSASSGWGYLGHPWKELLLLAVIAGVATVVLASRSGPGRPTYGAVSAVVLGTFAAGLILLLTLLRVLVLRPTPAADDLGSDAIVSAQAVSGSLVDLARAQAQLSPAVGAWVGLLGLLVLAAGMWMAMADDRTSAEESTTTPPPVAAIPPLKPPLPPEPEPAAEPESTEAAADPVDTEGAGSEPEGTETTASTDAVAPADDPAPAGTPDPAPAPDRTVPAASAPGTPAESLPPRTFRPPGAGPDDDPPPDPPDRP